MGKTQKKRKTSSRKNTRARAAEPEVRQGGAPAHQALANNLVHVFVDDQNLFWGIVNDERGISFRIDFGRLLLAASRDVNGKARGVKTAYIAGVIPDDDSFWEVAKSQGFTVRRGYLGSSGRSKLDDAYLMTDLVSTLYEESGPSTIVLVAGDADYMPALKRSLEKGWRNEVLFISRGLSVVLTPVAHELRRLHSGDIAYY